VTFVGTDVKGVELRNIISVLEGFSGCRATLRCIRGSNDGSNELSPIIQIDMINDAQTVLCEMELKPYLFTRYKVADAQINIEVTKEKAKYDGRARYNIIVDEKQGIRVVGEDVERSFPVAETQEVPPMKSVLESLWEDYSRSEGLLVEQRYLSHAVQTLARYFKQCTICYHGGPQLCLQAENNYYSAKHNIRPQIYPDYDIGETTINLYLLKRCTHKWGNSVKIWFRHRCPLILEYSTWGWDVRYAVAPIVEIVEP